MPLFFGVYSRSAPLDPKVTEPMLADFGRGRELDVVSHDRFLLATVRSGEAMPIATAEDDAIVCGVAGNIAGVSPAPGASPVPATASANARATGVLQALRAGDDRALDRAEGTFALVHYERSTHSLLLANDPFGIHPVFLRRDEDDVVFGSEYEPMLQHPRFGGDLDLEAIGDFFTLGLSLGGATLFREIRNLAPGHRLRVEGNREDETACFQLDARVDERSEITHHAEAVAADMRAAVTELYGDGENLAHLISAGADTRLMLSCLSPDQRSRIEFLTAYLTLLDPETDREAIVARRIAERLGLRHRVVPEAYLEEEFALDFFERERRVLPQRMLGGWHGGEFLGGYGFIAAPIPEPLDERAVDARYESLFSAEFRRRSSRHPFETYRAALDGFGGNRFRFIIDQLTRSFFCTAYRGSRAGWLHPVRLPSLRMSAFWDSRLIQTLLKVPERFLMDYDLYNQVYRHHFPELTGIPTNSPLAARDDACMTLITEGTEPKAAIEWRYDNALRSFRDDPATWDRGFYAAPLREALADPVHPLTMRFIDFEAWLRRYAPA